jgi:hypothetical protein
MTEIHTTIPRRRLALSRIELVRAILLLLLALLVLCTALTYYENTFTPAARDQSSSTNTEPTPAGKLSPTAARALEAYGGEAVWKNATTVETTLTVGGLLFQTKGINIPPHATFTIDLKQAHTVISPVDQDGDIGILDGFSVTIKSPDGKIIDQRPDARDNLQNMSLTTKWDRLNLLYFLGYAFWGYNTLPYQLARTEIRWTELQDGVLQAEYGASLPAHSRVQRFWFDRQTGLLRRNDYTPVAATPDSLAANVVFEHGVSNGIPYPSKRRVKITPTQQYGWVLPYPDMVTIDVETWQLR